MKALLLLSFSLAAIAGCQNGTNTIAEKTPKAVPLYDTITKYDAKTGAAIGDTIVSVKSEQNMVPDKKYGNGDTIPVMRVGVGYIGDTVISSGIFIPAKEKGKQNQ